MMLLNICFRSSVYDNLKENWELELEYDIVSLEVVEKDWLRILLMFLF